ncbi:MAG: hypothetical protein AAFP78_01025 [Pseudomonadota bacterium]
MFRMTAFACVLMIAPAAAIADTLEMYDRTGAKVAVDTKGITGCTMVFDSSGDAFEFCRLEKIELRPQASTRMRPGATKGPERDSVIYAKQSPDPANR